MMILCVDDNKTPDDHTVDILGWRDRRDRGLDELGYERRGSRQDGVDDRRDPDYDHNRGNSPLFNSPNPCHR